MAEQQIIPSTAIRELTTAWISNMRSEFIRSPLASNVWICLIIGCAKKLIVTEFACPCNVNWNAPFAAAYLIVPAVVVFLLMMKIAGCRCRMSMEIAIVAPKSVPALFWIILVLWDGHSVACMGTTWSGNYVETDKAAPPKWCKPADLTSSQELDYKNEIHFWFFVSQCVGMGLIVLIIVMYLILKCCCQQEVRDVEAPRSPSYNRDAIDDIPL